MERVVDFPRDGSPHHVRRLVYVSPEEWRDPDPKPQSQLSDRDALVGVRAIRRRPAMVRD